MQIFLALRNQSVLFMQMTLPLRANMLPMKVNVFLALE